MKTESTIPYETYMGWIKRDYEAGLKQEVITGLRLLAEDLEKG